MNVKSTLMAAFGKVQRATKFHPLETMKKMLRQSIDKILRSGPKRWTDMSFIKQLCWESGEINVVVFSRA